MTAHTVLEGSQTMSVEAKARWWNRALPVKIIGVLLATVVVAGGTYLYLEPILRAWLWAFGHHSTATYQGVSVKVPWMWRQEETPAGQRQLRLVRARLGEPVEFESIVISDGKSTSPGLQTIGERLQVLAEKLGQKDFRGTSMSLDPRFSCMAPHFDQVRDWQVSCLSIDNHWSANLYGPVPDVDSFKLVLQNMASSHR
jgi:hypothetical protein